MNKFLRPLAYGLNGLLIAGGLVLVTQAYGWMEVALAIFLIIVPLVSLAAVYTGPDREERHLQRQLNKARMRREIREIIGKASQNG
ncbi:MAG: hypothetical protein KDJ15_05960 [Alphaproteobacteria bacterium]|nr:hypothetical protein [Alphaproteobacteria bacterium]